MFNIGGGELLAILLLALIVLGPERLPKAMGQAGRYIAQLRRMSAGFQDEIRRAIDLDDSPFRPGEETLKGPVPAIEDEVKVVSREPDDTGNTPSAGPDDYKPADVAAPSAVDDVAPGSGGDAGDDTADRSADAGDDEAAGAAGDETEGDDGPEEADGGPEEADGGGASDANVTPLRPRRDGDARATG